MGERGENYLDKYFHWDAKPNFPESFAARAVLLDVENKPADQQYELWAKATDADLENYASQKAEFTSGDHSEFMKIARERRSVAQKALGMEGKSTFEKAMAELKDDKKVYEDLENNMGTGDPK